MGSIVTQDILNWVTSQTGHSLNADEGVSVGPARQPITGVTVCWMPDAAAARFAAAAGHQLVIHHEALTYPYPAFTEVRERPYLSWPTNAERLAAFHQCGLTGCRIHTSADEIAVFRAFVDLLDLGEPVDRGKGKFEQVFEIPPTPYGRLIERVKKAVGLPAVRATCCRGMDRVVRRVALPWGGLGLSINIWYMAWLVPYGLDVMIAGEADNYGMRFCTEIGIDLIETSHEVSEVPGMARLAEQIQQAFPCLDVKVYRQECVWRIA